MRLTRNTNKWSKQIKQPVNLLCNYSVRCSNFFHGQYMAKCQTEISPAAEQGRGGTQDLLPAGSTGVRNKWCASWSKRACRMLERRQISRSTVHFGNEMLLSAFITRSDDYTVTLQKNILFFSRVSQSFPWIVSHVKCQGLAIAL